MDPVAASALAAFGLERSYQLVSYAIVRRRLKRRRWHDELAEAVARSGRVSLDKASTRRLGEWLRSGEAWERILADVATPAELRADIADVVYLAHKPRRGTQPHEQLSQVRAEADILLSEITRQVLDSLDSATALTFLANRQATHRSEQAAAFRVALADDHVALMNTLEAHHAEVLEALAAIAGRQSNVKVWFPSGPSTTVIETPAVRPLLRTDPAPGTTTALVGTNGVGKTLIARHIARRCANAGMTVWWVRASNPAVAQNDLMALGRAIGLTTPSDREVLAHLHTTDEPWLIVMDDAAPPATIHDLVPRGPAGTTLLTTNYTTWSDYAETTELFPWSTDEAAEYITSETEPGLDGPSHRDVAHRIATQLGGHPLACAQAARLCRNANLSLAEYEHLLARSSAAALDAELAIPPGYDRTVLWAWAAAVDTAEHRNEATLDLLTTFAWLSSEPFPIDLIDASETATSTWTETKLLIAQLAEASLLQVTPGWATCHRLVQSATRLLHTRTSTTEGLDAAARLVAFALPSHVGTADTRARYRDLLPHALQLVDHMETESPVTQAVDLGFRFVVFLRSEGQLSESHSLASRLHTLSESLTEVDPALKHVWERQRAMSFEDAGNADRAIDLLTTLIERDHKPLGERDTAILNTKVELGRLLATGQDHEQARSLQRDALTGLRSTHGDDSEQAMDARRWLAATERRAGDPHRAIALHREIEDWYDRTGGKSAVSRLINQSTMVMALTDAGLYDEAISLGTTTVEGCEKLLGPDHSETLAALDNLARAQTDNGDIDAAVTARTLILATRNAQYESDHPLVLQSRANLAASLSSAGRTSEALAIEEQNIALFTNRFGPDHPNTWTSQNNYATSLFATGENAKAARLFESVYRSRSAALGPNHPSTVRAEYNYLLASEAPDARMKSFIANLDEILGADAPTTVAARIKRAERLLDAGHTDEATRQARIVLAVTSSDSVKTRAHAVLASANLASPQT